jgi:hypothetical protein
MFVCATVWCVKRAVCCLRWRVAYCCGRLHIVLMLIPTGLGEQRSSNAFGWMVERLPATTSGYKSWRAQRCGAARCRRKRWGDVDAIYSAAEHERQQRCCCEQRNNVSCVGIQHAGRGGDAVCEARCDGIWQCGVLGERGGRKRLEQQQHEQRTDGKQQQWASLCGGTDAAVCEQQWQHASVVEHEPDEPDVHDDCARGDEWMGERWIWELAVYDQC